jgi:hypothetical protein
MNENSPTIDTTTFKTPLQVLANSTIDADELRAALVACNKNIFEDWCQNFFVNNATAHAAEKTVHDSMTRAGLPSSTERVRELDAWGEQVKASLPLAAATGISAQLDYSQPIVLCYFCLWLQRHDATDQAHGVIDWKEVLALDLWCLAMS